MVFGLDLFGGQKAADRVQYFYDRTAEIAKAPERAYRNIERHLAATLAHDTPIFGRRYTPIWNDAVRALQALLAAAEKPVRVKRIAKLQEDIAQAEETLREIAAGRDPWSFFQASPDIIALWKAQQPLYLEQLKEQLMAAKYGPLAWVPEFPESPHPTERPLTPAQAAAATRELLRR